MELISKIDLRLFLPAFLLAAVGSLVLASVSPRSFPGQFVFLSLAFLAFVLATNVDIRIFKTLSPSFYVLSLVLLLITFLFGVFSRGAVRWINLGFFTLQASEIVKPLLLLFFAWVVTRDTKSARFLIALIGLVPVALLIFVQPDLGSTLVILAGFLGVIFMGGVPLKYFLLVLAFSVIASPLGWHFLANYQKDRLLSHFNQEADSLGDGYNSIQAVIATGSGGGFGRGLGQGTQSQLLFLPERHTDFIFAAIGEELGFVGAGIIVLSFGLLFWRLVSLINKTRDFYTKAYLGGLFTTLFSQTAINIGMNLGVLPVTGIPLPLVSSGGSSLVAMAFGLGIASSMGTLLKRETGLGII